MPPASNSFVLRVTQSLPSLTSRSKHHNRANDALPFFVKNGAPIARPPTMDLAPRHSKSNFLRAAPPPQILFQALPV